MDNRLHKQTTARVVPQLERGTNSSANRGRRQFRPRLDAADEGANETATNVTPPLSETKREPVHESSAEKRPRMTNIRGYEFLPSIFASGAGQNAPRPSAPRLSADDGGGSRSHSRHGGSGGAQENLVEIMGGDGYDVSDVGATDASNIRGSLDPITPFHDSKITPVEDTQQNCSSLLFENRLTSPIIFQLPLGSLFHAAALTNTGPLRIGSIQRLKSGKMRLLIPLAGSAEQEVPNVTDSNLGNHAGSVMRQHTQSIALSFSSSSQPHVLPLNQIVCVYSPQSAAVKPEPMLSVTVTKPNRPANIPNMTSNMFMLGRVSARVSSSVNL